MAKAGESSDDVENTVSRRVSYFESGVAVKAISAVASSVRPAKAFSAVASSVQASLRRRDNFEGASPGRDGLRGKSSCISDHPSIKGLQGSCPFMHGTVRCDPFPGYVHGRNPVICSNGCEPCPPGLLDELESPEERMIREALEFNALYHKEHSLDDVMLAARAAQIKAEIAETGVYTHTFDELQHGARVGWRNASKCINRQAHMGLMLNDCRDVATNRAMFDAIVAHIKRAAAGESVVAVVSAFKPSKPTFQNEVTKAPWAMGPRVWNSQLVRFAGHTLADGSVLGDPAEQEFTQMVKDVFGWRPKGPLSRFDVLPIICQIDPNEPPELFELPEECHHIVAIEHPRFGWMEKLGLKWYAIPAVSSIELSLGGLCYTSTPFNGWYMVAEVATRNFGDESRYNMLPAVAELMELDTKNEGSMWREYALAALNEAVNYSFTKAGYSIANHHTTARSFQEWYDGEKASRGYCPANWKWVIPPTAGSTSSLYLNGAKWLDYTLYPQWNYSPSTAKLLKWLAQIAPKLPSEMQHALVMRTLLSEVAAEEQLVGRASGQLLVAYASNGGETARRANEASRFFGAMIEAKTVDLKSYIVSQGRWDMFARDLRRATAVLLLVSTCGSGNASPGAAELIVHLQKQAKAGTDEAGVLAALNGTRIALLGRGNSGYARYNQAGVLLHRLLQPCGVEELVPFTKTDELQYEASTFAAWLKAITNKLAATSVLDAEKVKEALLTIDDGATPGAAERASWHVLSVHRSLTDEQHRRGPRPKEHFVGEVLESNELLAHPSWEHSSRCITVDISRGLHKHGGNLKYKPGDHIKVLGQNSAHIVRLMCAHLGVEPDEAFDLVSSKVIEEYVDAGMSNDALQKALVNQSKCGGDMPFRCPTTYGQAFREHLDVLRPPTRELLLALKPLVSEEEQKELKRLITDPALLADWIEEEEVRVIDLFDRFPELSAAHGGGNFGHFADHLAESTVGTRRSRPFMQERSCFAAHLENLRAEKVNVREEQSVGGFSALSSPDKAATGRSCFGQISSPEGLEPGGHASPSRAVMSALVSNCSTIEPRSYSIASSQRFAKHEVAIVMSKLTYKTAGRGLPRKGFCSSYLAELEAGHALFFSFSSAPSFHLPASPQTPIMMVAAGTGIAPFRGFIQERMQLSDSGHTLGPAFLFFGCRSPNLELLESTTSRALSSRVLTKYLVAYSRSRQHPRRYVNRVVAEEEAAILKLIEDGGHIYLCGDANMATGVVTELKRMIGQEAWAHFEDDGRFHEDIFGNVLTSVPVAAKADVEASVKREKTIRSIIHDAGEVSLVDPSYKDAVRNGAIKRADTVKSIKWMAMDDVANV